METDFFSSAQVDNDRAPAFIVETSDEADVLHVFGDLDYAAVAEFEATLARAVKIGHPLIVELGACTHIEASALGVLARARGALGPLLTVRTAEGGIVRRIFEITGLPHDVAKAAMRGGAMPGRSPMVQS
jgi:anti-anti-sigma factor